MAHSGLWQRQRQRQRSSRVCAAPVARQGLRSAGLLARGRRRRRRRRRRRAGGRAGDDSSPWGRPISAEGSGPQQSAAARTGEAGRRRVRERCGGRSHVVRWPRSRSQRPPACQRLGARRRPTRRSGAGRADPRAPWPPCVAGPGGGERPDPMAAPWTEYKSRWGTGKGRGSAWRWHLPRRARRSSRRGRRRRERRPAALISGPRSAPAGGARRRRRRRRRRRGRRDGAVWTLRRHRIGRCVRWVGRHRNAVERGAAARLGPPLVPSPAPHPTTPPPRQLASLVSSRGRT